MLTWALVSFCISIVFVLVTIIKLKVHPFLSLLLGAVIMGLLCGLPLPTISGELANGFGGTLTGIGIIIALGVILGQLLHESGCAEEIAAMVLRMTGQKNAALAMNLTGYIVSIPVFFDAAFVILLNLVKNISRKGKIPFITLVTSLAVGLITTHAMVIPTPGPLAVAANMEASIAVFLIYSLIVSLPASLIGGVVYGKWLGNKPEYMNDFANSFDDEPAVEAPTGNRPSGALGVSLILLPIIMILLGTVMGQFLEKDTLPFQIFDFIGNKNIALLVGTLVAYLSLKKYLTRSFNDIIADAAASTGSILIITGAGGSFGKIINATAIGSGLKDVLGGLAGTASVGVLLVVVAFLISQVLRCAQGSTTVALVTTSAIMGPIVSGIDGASSVLVGLAICAGGIGLSLPNDSGFWVVNRFSKFSVGDTFRAWTIAGTISGVTSLVILIVLSLFSGVLPGLS